MLCSIPKIKKPKPLKNDRKMSEQSRKRIQEAKQRMHEMKFSPSKENNTIFDAPNFFQIVSPAKGKISRKFELYYIFFLLFIFNLKL